MKTIAAKIQTIEGLTVIERAARTVVGIALIGSVFVASENTLGWLAVLPLLGIYPLYTGLTGAASMSNLFDNNPAMYRVTQAAVTAALIGSVFVTGAVPLGAVVILPLIGIYTALSAILGRSPLATEIDATKAIPYVVPPAAEDIAALGTGTTRNAIPRAA